MAIFSDKSWEQWLSEYSEGHQNPINRRCHSVGIPIILLSIAMLPWAFFFPELLKPALILFALGWALQFIGHIYEKKPPEFFKDWRFLFVGARWWFLKTFTKHRY